MPRTLILDDDPERHKAFEKALKDHDRVHVDNYFDAVQQLAGAPFDYVYLDHDLGDHNDKSKVQGTYGGYEMTGNDVVDWMVDNMQQRPGTVVVHSWNFPGATRMMQKLQDAGFKAIRAPFAAPVSYTKEEEGSGT